MEPTETLTWTQIIFSQILRFGGVFAILFALYVAVVITGKILSKLPSKDPKS